MPGYQRGDDSALGLGQLLDKYRDLKKKKASLQKEDEGSRHPDRNGYKLQIQRDNGECLGF